MPTLPYVLILPVMGSLGVLYAWWSQPYLGSASAASVVARSLVIIVWLAVFVIIRRSKSTAWSWKYFLIGGVLGGGWWSLSFPLNEAQGLVNVAMGLVVGSISGLFAGLASTGVRAALTGIGIFVGQILVNVLIHAAGWTKFSYGM